jgi:hypothetical protein
LPELSPCPVCGRIPAFSSGSRAPRFYHLPIYLTCEMAILEKERALTEALADHPSIYKLIEHRAEIQKLIPMFECCRNRDWYIFRCILEATRLSSPTKHWFAH